jgi:electron transport complex protein RnfC
MKWLSALLQRLGHRPRAYTAFHGGIHPPTYKSLSNQLSIRSAPLPELLVLPLQQHIGQMDAPIVQAGERVLKGQKIASAQGLGADLHAPTSGQIVEISEQHIPHASGLKAPCILLKPDGQDLWRERSPIENPYALSRDQLCERLASSGIVGLGGAGFPTHAKLKISQSVDTILINGAECEPFITCDDRQMREQSEPLFLGAQLMAYLLNAKQVIFALEDNKPQAIAQLKSEIAHQHAIGATLAQVQFCVRTFPTIYPTGGQKQLVQLLTGLEMAPHTHLPEYGMQMFNIGTTRAVYRAVYLDEPLISRVVTVTSPLVTQGYNYEVLLGTPFSTLLAHAKIPVTGPTLMGGPMMGVQMPCADVPVIKTTNCILQMPPVERAEHMPCIRCGECMEACPVNLLPQQLYWFSRANELEKAEAYHLEDCIECGCCAYVCPSEIPLVQYYRHTKSALKQSKIDAKKAEIAKERHQFQLERIARAEQEREERLRKKREEALLLAQTKQATASQSDAPATPPPGASAAAAAARARAMAAKKKAALAEQQDAEQAKDDA